MQRIPPTDGANGANGANGASGASGTSAIGAAIDSIAAIDSNVAIRAALAEHRPRTVEDGPPPGSTAAVALVLAGKPHLSLCVIRRAERADDPWSGHLALPGGRASPADPTPRAVAERETREEVGLALAGRHYLGALSQVTVRLGARAGNMSLYPFVYYLGADLAPFLPSPEVATAFWVPLSYLWDPRNATLVSWDRDGARPTYPGIRWRDQAIWGLTLRVLTLFSDVLDAPLPHLEPMPSRRQTPEIIEK
jgi:8-oxo-dGTP pyrophosphatase MutT (NUDIX family)